MAEDPEDDHPPHPTRRNNNATHATHPRQRQPDHDHHRNVPRPTNPKDLTVEQATALLAEIWASEVLPDHAKARLSQQIDYRLEEAAGKGQQPQSVVAGVFFNGASPDEVMTGLKALAAQR